MILKYIIDEEKILVKEYLELIVLSRNISKKARVEDIIYINGEKGKNFYPLKKGDVLELKFDEQLNEEILVNDKDLDIIYEDDYIMLINKENDISSQPSQKHPLHNVISCVKYYFIKNNINSNVHLVNRLDYSTSGLMIIAKDGITHFEFTKVDIVKKYICEIQGHIQPQNGTINLPIDREEAPSIKRFVSDSGKQSVTHYKVLQSTKETDFIEATLQTGRTHQIRVHFSHLGHPLIGDGLYGIKEDVLKLHCYYLSFIHPWTKEKLEFINYPKWIGR